MSRTAHHPRVSIESNSGKGELNRTVTWQGVAVGSVMDGYFNAAEPEGGSPPVRLLYAILVTSLSKQKISIHNRIFRFLSRIIPRAKAGIIQIIISDQIR
ncbi:MAG: hypothetical protein ACP5O1_00405 [Phycisphaerae bacterium]